MQAKDVMTTEVVAVTEDTPVHEVVGKLIKHPLTDIGNARFMEDYKNIPQA